LRGFVTPAGFWAIPSRLKLLVDSLQNLSRARLLPRLATCIIVRRLRREFKWVRTIVRDLLPECEVERQLPALSGDGDIRWWWERVDVGWEAEEQFSARVAICFTPHGHTGLGREEKLPLALAGHLGKATQPGRELGLEYIA
jgi:hypothetical protein